MQMVACMMGAPLVAATVAINPPGINTNVVNGNPYSGSATANVSDGVGPFTYAWSWLAGGTGITLAGTTSVTVAINSASTSNTTRSGTLQCIVTDTGNGSVTTSDNISVSITWGMA